MKSFLLVLLSFFSLLGAYELKDNEIEVTYRDGLVYKKFSDIPYTGKGVLIDKYLVTKVNTINGKFDGVIKSYYQKNGNLSGIINYKNGKENGLMKIYTENGNLYAELNYKDGSACEGWYKFLETDYIIKDCKKTGVEIDYKEGKSIKITWENGIKVKEQID